MRRNVALAAAAARVLAVVRLYARGIPGGWFLEGGIGPYAISPRYQNGTRELSSVFNFADHVGLGLRLGQRSEHELALRVEHLSNCGIGKRNPGEEFVQLRYADRL